MQLVADPLQPGHGPRAAPDRRPRSALRRPLRSPRPPRERRRSSSPTRATSRGLRPECRRPRRGPVAGSGRSSRRGCRPELRSGSGMYPACRMRSGRTIDHGVARDGAGQLRTTGMRGPRRCGHHRAEELLPGEWGERCMVSSSTTVRVWWSSTLGACSQRAEASSTTARVRLHAAVPQSRARSPRAGSGGASARNGRRWRSLPHPRRQVARFAGRRSVPPCHGSRNLSQTPLIPIDAAPPTG